MYRVKRLFLDIDQKAYYDWCELLRRSELKSDEQVDFTVGIYDGDRLIATGSLFQNILKCIAVCKDYQSENLLTKILQVLINRLHEFDCYHYFLYTKLQTAPFFKNMGFSEIARTEHLVFMEQGYPDFTDYLEKIKQEKRQIENAAGIVMKADPFTKGHLHLVETAARLSEIVYLFVVSDRHTKFPSLDRLQLVKKGTAHLPNVVVLPTDSYMVSRATFPTYFLQGTSEESHARIQAELDATIFKEKIAPVLSIKTRFVGEEPFSRVTEIYNESMQKVFANDIKLQIIPRKKVNGTVISATRVRQCFENRDFLTIKELVPLSTYEYLVSLLEQPVLVHN